MDKKTLYHKGKAGETRVWSVWSQDDKIFTEYGVLDGELQVSEKKATPKNVGKKNETSAEQQAELEAKSLWQFKLDRKYSTTIEGAQEPLLLPMLAKEYKEKDVKFPCFIQPKLDGVRALAFWDGDKIKLISRAGKEWTIPKHINEQVAKILPKDSMFDGELYIHGKSCQTITSYVKKFREVETPTIEYHIYDMPVINGDDAKSYDTRYKILAQLFQDHMKPSNVNYPLCLRRVENLIFVNTRAISQLEDIAIAEQKFLDEGYEGAILRNADATYIFGYRSQDLMKLKRFQDAEFEVVSIREGIGKFEGCAVFQCKNDLTEGVFECTTASSMEERAKFFSEKEKYIGRKLTVKFFDRTDDKLPRFPVGKLFRSDKDQ